MPARSPGANPVRHASASSGLVSQRTEVIPIGPAQLGLDLGHQQVQLAAAALEAAAGLLGRPGDPGLGDHDGHERLGAHRGLGQSVGEVVVDLLGQLRGVGAAVLVDPQLPLGAVLGDGADHEEDLVDLLGAAGDVDQPGQRLAVAVRAPRCPPCRCRGGRSRR